MNRTPSPPLSSRMSEFDSLSDSDWLDISSGRDSDDNDSLSSQDSDHEEISSMPQSRRSSISNGSSMNSEVEAWEGFVSDEAATEADVAIGMFYAPLPSALGAEPIVVGFIPDVNVNEHPAVAPEADEEDRRVRDALDQSFVGTLSASRSSTTGGHFSSTHTSIHDLRLSFPDPLTSSHDELNSSYHNVSPTETNTSASTDNDDTHEPTTASIVSSSLLQPEDPDITPPISGIPCPEPQQHFIESEEKSDLEIMLYGASSEIKWQFIQDLIQKAAANSGRVLVNPLQSGTESKQIQTLRLLKDSKTFEAPFFNVVTVHDRTGGRLSPKLEVDTLNSDPDHLSLAIVYLPTAKLPVLPWHTSFLPVLVSSSILNADFDNAVALQAAEDDWDLLCVPANRTLNPSGTKSPIFDSNELLHITSEQAYGIFQDIGRESKKVTLKPITEQVKSVNAVTLFALVSIIMGFVFNTAFRPSTPAPTPTINTPSSSSSHLWGMFNRSVVSPTANTVPIKDMALSVFNPGTTAVSVASPPAAMSLSVASSSKSIAEVTTISPSTSSSHTKCVYCKSAPDKSRTSTDIVIRSESTTALSEVHMKTSVSIVSRPEGSSSSNTILFGDPTTSYSANPKATTSSSNIIGFSDVLDATSKALENVGNDIAVLAEAADELITSLRMQRDNIISQSKGKARALSEQLQHLNEEMINRNEHAKARAKELKKRGEELLWNTQEMLKKRTKRARGRAKELGKSVLESEAYRKVQEEMESRLSGEAWGDGANGQEGKRKKRKRDKENVKACRKSRRLLRPEGSRAEHCI